jgi:hypothetical protein
MNEVLRFFFVDIATLIRHACSLHDTCAAGLLDPKGSICPELRASTEILVLRTITLFRNCKFQ